MDTKDGERIDKILSAYTSDYYYEVFDLLGIEPEGSQYEMDTILITTIGKILADIDGGVDYLISRYPNENSQIQDAIIKFVIAANDYDKMFFLINNREQYNITGMRLRRLYSGLAKSPKYRHIPESVLMDKEKSKSEGLFDSIHLEEMACSFQDSNIVEKFLNLDFISELRYSIIDILRMIVSTGDAEYIKKYATDPALIEKMRFQDKHIARLAIASKDEKLLRECLSKKDSIRNNKIILRIIMLLKDPDLMKRAMRNPSEFRLYTGDICQIAFQGGFSKDELENIPTFCDSKEGKAALALMYGDYSFADSLINSDESELDIPERMTAGIEIEVLGFFSRLLKLKKEINGWKAISDESIQGKKGEEGLEFVSSVLRGENKKRSKSIKKATAILKSLGEYSNESCGGHVHIGADYLTSKQAFYNLLELYANNEKILYTISNKEGEIPRYGIENYAAPISQNLERKFADTVQLNDIDDLDKFKEKIAETQDYRIRGLNFKNLGPHGKGTIEFRISNGTTDSKTWIENINLYGGLVRAAEEISLIQKKNLADRTDEEKEKLEIFNALGTDESLTEEKRLEYLLKLVIQNPQKRDIYTGRYRVNSELIKKNKYISYILDAGTSKKLIRYSNKVEIGKAVFAGKNPINGGEMRECGDLIENEMNKLGPRVGHEDNDG